MQLRLVSDLDLSVQHVVVAGIGVPQVTAVMDCYEVADQLRNSDHRRWRYQVFRRYYQGDRSRCECLHDGKYVRRM